MLYSRQSARIPFTSIVYLQMLSMEATVAQFVAPNGRNCHFVARWLLQSLKEVQGLILLMGSKMAAT